MGESKSGLIIKITNIPVAKKGGQIVMVTDVDCAFPGVYTNGDNMNTHPDKFKTRLPNKVIMTIKKLEEMVLGSPTILGTKKLYNNQPEICWNKYLYHYVIFDYAGKKGFDLIMAVHRDRIPDGVPEKYM